MRKASGNDLKHTVTCLAAEPLGLLKSEDVNNLDGGNFIGYIPITHFSCVCAKGGVVKRKFIHIYALVRYWLWNIYIYIYISQDFPLSVATSHSSESTML